MSDIDWGVESPEFKKALESTKGIYQFRKPVTIPFGLEFADLDEFMVALTTALNKTVIDATRSAEERDLIVDHVQFRWVNIPGEGRYVRVEMTAHNEDYKGPLPIRPIWEASERGAR